MAIRIKPNAPLRVNLTTLQVIEETRPVVLFQLYQKAQDDTFEFSPHVLDYLLEDCPNFITRDNTLTPNLKQLIIEVIEEIQHE